MSKVININPDVDRLAKQLSELALTSVTFAAVAVLADGTTQNLMPDDMKHDAALMGELDILHTNLLARNTDNWND